MNFFCYYFGPQNVVPKYLFCSKNIFVQEVLIGWYCLGLSVCLSCYALVLLFANMLNLSSMLFPCFMIYIYLSQCFLFYCLWNQFLCSIFLAFCSSFLWTLIYITYMVSHLLSDQFFFVFVMCQSNCSDSTQTLHPQAAQRKNVCDKIGRGTGK